MNKFGFLLALTAICGFSSAVADTCVKAIPDGTFNGIDFIDMKTKCTKQTEEQIKKEITASLKYLAMGAYFARDNVNRPGFSKLFIEAAGEEREHASKLIEYLSMRGRYLDAGSTITHFNISELVTDAVKSPKHLGVQFDEYENIEEKTTTSGLVALKNALKLEVAVTKSIRELVEVCEKDEDFNHYHFVDYLTGEFLEEQYKGQRDLAGKIATLAKMVANQGTKLADFLFDKQL